MAHITERNAQKERKKKERKTQKNKITTTRTGNISSQTIYTAPFYIHIFFFIPT